MEKKNRRKFIADFKANGVLEAIKEQSTFMESVGWLPVFTWFR
jgi:hypothetical protein